MTLDEVLKKIHDGLVVELNRHSDELIRLRGLLDEKDRELSEERSHRLRLERRLRRLEKDGKAGPVKVGGV